MKLTKSLFLAFAGLGLFACSNEDVTDGGNNLLGNGAVEVKIVSPNDFSRTVAGSTDGKVKVEGEITVKLTYDNGKTKTVNIDPTQTTTAKFWDITNPQTVEAYVNDGNLVTTSTNITNPSSPNMQALPVAIPAYGLTEDINLNGKTDTNEGKTYEMYAATVNMTIPVARLEVSGITHVKHPYAEGEGEDGYKEESCKYEVLTIDGIYLDKLYVTQDAVKSNTVTDYHYPEAGGVPTPILWEEIPDSPSFLTEGAKWPAEEGQVYAFNFFPGKEIPILKIYFANATATDDQNPVSQPRYAVIKSYNGDPDFQFKAGTIYRLKDVQLADKNILGDEEGNTLFGVDVTVTEASWDVIDVSGEWTE